MNSDKRIIRKPEVIVKGSKEMAREWYEEKVEEMSTGEGRNWVYTDRSKKEGRAAIAWTWMTGDGAVKETNNMAVNGRYNIEEIEMMAIAMALTDAKRRQIRRCWVFTDSQSAAIAIRDIENEDSDTAGLWDIMAPILNDMEEVGIG